MYFKLSIKVSNLSTHNKTLQRVRGVKSLDEFINNFLLYSGEKFKSEEVG